MELIKLAIIGGGRVALHHCEMLREVAEIKLIAACELRKDRGQILSERYNVPLYENYYTMLSENPDIDVVTIATPSGMHFEHSIDVIKNYKKHIVIEKPTFMRPDQLIEAYKLAESNGCKIFPVFQNRYNKAVNFVKSSIENKELGEVRMASARVRWCRPQRYYDRDAWRGTWSHDGGALTNQGVHYLDILRYLGGEITKVNALSVTQSVNVEVDDTVAAVFEFVKGGLGVIEITTSAYPEDFEASVSIVGSKGLAVVSGEATNKLVTFSPDPEKCEAYSEEFKIVYGTGHQEMYRDISRVLREGGEQPVSARDALKTLVLLHSIYLSAERQDWVQLSDGNQSNLLGRTDEQISKLYRTSKKIETKNKI